MPLPYPAFPLRKANALIPYHFTRTTISLSGLDPITSVSVITPWKTDHKSVP